MRPATIDDLGRRCAHCDVIIRLGRVGDQPATEYPTCDCPPRRGPRVDD